MRQKIAAAFDSNVDDAVASCEALLTNDITFGNNLLLLLVMLQLLLLLLRNLPR